MIDLKDATFDGTFPFAPRHHEVKGFAIHFVDEGTGEPVVLVHGDPTWGYPWRRFIPALLRRRRCVVPDHMAGGPIPAVAGPHPLGSRRKIRPGEKRLRGARAGGEDAGHFLQEDAPERIVGWIAAFLDASP